MRPITCKYALILVIFGPFSAYAQDGAVNSGQDDWGFSFGAFFSGVASGFAHVDRDSYATRLLHCKGKRTVRCHEVAVSSASLNTGDVFILDVGLTLFVWNGYTTIHDARLVFFLTHARTPAPSPSEASHF